MFVIDEIPYPSDEDETDSFVLYSPPFFLEELREQDADCVSEWLRRFEGKSAVQILDLLRSDWQRITAKTSRQFADYLLEGEVQGVGVYRTQAWIAITTGEGRLLIPKPYDLSAEEEAFIAAFEEPALWDFCHYFHHCTEWDPWRNALWLSPPEPHTDAEFGGDMSEWEGGIGVYYICSGDYVLLNQDGRLAHSLHEIVWAGRVKDGTRHVLNSFDEFICYYIQRLSGRLEPKAKLLFEGDYHGELKLINTSASN